MTSRNGLALVLLLAGCIPLPAGGGGGGFGGGGGGARRPPAEWIASFTYDASNVHVANNCQDSIGVGYGSHYDPNAGVSGMNANTAIDAPRNGGSTAIWLSTGEHISVGSDVRVVEVDASCRRLVRHK